jgi:hypothetical protein
MLCRALLGRSSFSMVILRWCCQQDVWWKSLISTACGCVFLVTATEQSLSQMQVPSQLGSSEQLCEGLHGACPIITRLAPLTMLGWVGSPLFFLLHPVNPALQYHLDQMMQAVAELSRAGIPGLAPVRREPGGVHWLC